MRARCSTCGTVLVVLQDVPGYGVVIGPHHYYPPRGADAEVLPASCPGPQRMDHRVFEEA